MNSHRGVEGNGVGTVDNIDVAKACEDGSDQCTESQDLRCDDVTGTFPAKEKEGGTEREKSKGGGKGHSAGRRDSDIGPGVPEERLISPERQIETIRLLLELNPTAGIGSERNRNRQSDNPERTKQKAVFGLIVT
jgi:hypothetical protein